MDKKDKNNRSIIYNLLVDWFSKDPKRYNLIHLVINWGLPYKFVSNVIDLKPGEKILEIACGPALILDYLKDNPYVGIDLNDKHLEYAKNKYKKRKNSQFINSNILEYDFKNHGKFDKILMLGFMHHLPDDKLKNLLLIVPGLLNNENKNSCLVTFDPVRTKYHFISNKLCDLDQGRYVRNAEHYRNILNLNFNLDESNIITSRTKASVYLVNKAIAR